uniref:Cap-specific mRNA (nucleoside-2'-O-)-methyltransferase 1 n=2 Tax=Hirondellea gigas TaxID=1518452 RepID=A0A6A7FUP5_9CRUS
MSNPLKRPYEDSDEEIPNKRRTLSQSSQESSSQYSSIDSSYSRSYLENHSPRSRFASSDSLGENNGSNYQNFSEGASYSHNRSISSDTASPQPSPDSTYGSYDSGMGGGAPTWPPDNAAKPNYSHSSSSHKFQDYSKSDDENDSLGLHAGFSGASAASLRNNSTNDSDGRAGFGASAGAASYRSSTDSNNDDTAAATSDQETDKDGHIYSSAAQKMMSMMGYEPGRGLGARGSGRLEPVEASQQRGRRGLGHAVTKPVPTAISEGYEAELEEVSAKEEVVWMPPCSTEAPLSLAQLCQWNIVGPRKEDISEETTYCNPDVLSSVLTSKNVFDELGEREIQRARLRSNPYETVGKVFFQNRAALKMANLDAVTGMMFTQPLDQNGHPMVTENDVLYFADVCAAPGGFAEYVIWRRKDFSNGFPDVHGFGFTLRSNDFKLQDFYAAPRECFEPHYGESGRAGDGDIYKPSNVRNFCRFVKTATQGHGVHFMMADGGFSVEGQENIQEILSKQLYLGQFMVALGIVREGGNFVCKLFDLFTPFSVGLIYLMYRCFRGVALHKPNTSRPANSERYIICKWLKPGTECVFKYMFEVNEQLCSLNKTEEDVVQIVPPEVIAHDTNFFNYITHSNDTIGRNQTISLQKIRLFAEDPSQVESRQGTLRSLCLKLWQVPDMPRTAPVREQPNRKVADLLKQNSMDSLSGNTEELSTPHCLTNHVHSIYDYRFVVTAVPSQQNKSRAFYLGLSGRNVYRSNSLSINSNASSSWERLALSVELPPDTLLYAELVDEIRGMSVTPPSPRDVKSDVRNQRRVMALHVIDAICLNGFHVANLHLVERHRYLRRFCRAVNKSSRPDLLPIRCKKLFKLEEVPLVLNSTLLSVRQVKNSGIHRVMHSRDMDDADGIHIPATGILLISTTKKPWMMAVSKTNKRKYFYNTITKEAMFETKVECIAGFSSSYNSSLLWHWNHGTVVLGNDKGIGGELADSDSDDNSGDQQPSCPKKKKELLHLKHLVDMVQSIVTANSFLGKSSQ